MLIKYCIRANSTVKDLPVVYKDWQIFKYFDQLGIRVERDRGDYVLIEEDQLVLENIESTEQLHEFLERVNCNLIFNSCGSTVLIPCEA